MMNIIKNWLVSALVILLVAYLLQMINVGVTVSGFVVALKVALVLGLVNAIIKPIVLFFTLPITILTLGLFVFVVNALMIMLTATIIDGFAVTGFLSALIFSLALSFFNAIFKGGDKPRGNSTVYEKAEFKD